MCSIWLCVEWKTNVGKTWPLPSRSLESSWFIETTLRQRSCIIVRESQLEKKKHLTVEGGWSEKETSEGGVECAGGEKSGSRMFGLLSSMFQRQLIAKCPTSVSRPIASPPPLFSEVRTTWGLESMFPSESL